AAGADAAVEGEEVPDVEGPDRVLGLAGRGPGDGFEAAEVGGAATERAREAAELVGGARDLDRAGGVGGDGLAPPGRRQPAAAGVAGAADLDLVGLVGDQVVEVRDVELGEAVAPADLFQPVVERLLPGGQRVRLVVGEDAEDQRLGRQPVVPVDHADRAG